MEWSVPGKYANALKDWWKQNKTKYLTTNKKEHSQIENAQS